MDRAELLDKLDKVTDKAANFAISKGYPMPVSKKAILIGSILVEKNKNGYYDILKIDKTILYPNISVFDVAIIIAQRYNNNEFSSIKKVLDLEEKFSKYHCDMTHYLHAMKGAKKSNDNERLAILEDKFQVAESLAKITRDKLSVFKRIK